MKKETMSRVTFWMAVSSAFLTGWFAVKFHILTLAFLWLTVFLFFYRRWKGLI